MGFYIFAAVLIGIAWIMSMAAKNNLGNRNLEIGISLQSVATSVLSAGIGVLVGKIVADLIK
jgi:hypothetical protein